MIVINRQYCRFDSQILRSFSPGCPVGIKLRSVVSFTADDLYDRFSYTFFYTWSATKQVRMEAPSAGPQEPEYHCTFRYRYVYIYSNVKSSGLDSIK